VQLHTNFGRKERKTMRINFNLEVSFVRYILIVNLTKHIQHLHWTATQNISVLGSNALDPPSSLSSSSSVAAPVQPDRDLSRRFPAETWLRQNSYQSLSRTTPASKLTWCVINEMEYKWYGINNSPPLRL
jgi:hypothetical protein